MTDRSLEGAARAGILRPSFEMRADLNGETALVGLSGEFDLAAEPEFAGQVARIEGDRFRKVVLDLSEVTFIDSTGLRLILGLWERSRERGAELVLVRGPDAVHRVFEVTGLENVVPIVDGRPGTEG
jgi:anti-sigma B factor antagonist